LKKLKQILLNYLISSKVKKTQTNLEGVIIEKDGKKIFSSDPVDIKKEFVNKWLELYKSKKVPGLSKYWFKPQGNQIGTNLLDRPISINEVKKSTWIRSYSSQSFKNH
jgi:hypothetical protein